MSPVNSSLVERKLGLIAERMNHLEKYFREGWDAYKDNFERRKTTEKLLQELIEAAIDINSHLMVESGRSAPEDYFQSFIGISKDQWISDDLARELAPSAGLRNRLVHQYTEVDDRKVFEAVGSVLGLFRRYSSEIRKKL